MIKVIYAILLGVVLALFVGLGIEVFYPTEPYPEYPKELENYRYEEGKTLPEDLKVIQKDFDQRTEEYQDRMKIQNRNISIIAISASILLAIISLLISEKYMLFSNGILIGSLLTLLYSIIRGMMSDNNIFRFLLVTVGLIVVLFLGYWKFIKGKDK